MVKTCTILIIFSLFSCAFGAQTEIFCAHAELCKLVSRIGNAHGVFFKTKTVVNMSGDPHEYEPSAAEIKNLISASFLVTGPAELNPWVKKIALQRAKMPETKTLALNFDPKDFTLYKAASPEALSHFWIYPRVYCAFQKRLEEEMLRRDLIKNMKMNCDYQVIEEQLKKELNAIAIPLVLTHDALFYLLNDLRSSDKPFIVSIKGSGHHAEISTEAIKKLYQALNDKSVIWIKEKAISIPATIQDKIRPSDKVIEIDTAKSEENAPFSVLVELTRKFGQIKDKK